MIKKSPVVYISYCRSSAEDTAWAKQLAGRLRDDGIRTLVDDWELQPGMDYAEWYYSALQKSDSVLLVATRDVMENEYSEDFNLDDLDALRDAADRFNSPRFIPLLLGPSSSKSLPYPFRGKVGIKMDSANPEFGYEKLKAALTGHNSTSALALRERSPTSRDPSRAVVLKQLRVSNFRRVQGVTVVHKNNGIDAELEAGQWTILLGDNGAGKSSLLWAIGLGLLDRDLAQAILTNISSPLIQFGQSECLVEVTESSTTYNVHLAHQHGREQIGDSSSGAPDFMIFGYGTARGAAFGGPQRSVELDRPLNAINTLFGIPTNLVHAETWIEGLERNALKSEEGSEQRQIFENVCSVLKRVLPGIDEIVLDAERIRFIGPSVGDCTTDSLSDGYATTLGWIVDMMARWIHEQQRLERPIPTDFNLHMTGLVLIDELDLHLHPRWQMRIIDDIRRAFPKMSFVATTHNPLTLLGAKPGEIFVLDSSADELQVRQVDLPPGIRADQILTGIWFGLSSTLDIETQHMLDQHRELLRAGTPKEDSRRIELERQLRTRLGSFADTSADRVAQEIVTREMETNASPLTKFELETVREKVQKALAQKP